MQTLETNTLIIGAGPIGLELASVFKRTGHDYLQVDAGQVGQTVSWYPRDATFFSSPERIAISGVPLNTNNQSKATREQYLTYLRSVVEQFDLRVRTHQRVTDVTRSDTGFEVITQRTAPSFDATKPEPRSLEAAAQSLIRCEHLVLAIGDMHRPVRLGIPGEDLPHVSHYFVDPHHHFQRRVLIVGGKNSAVEAALRCYKVGADVSISYRGEDFSDQSIKYWLLPEIRSLIKHDKIHFHPRTRPLSITPEAVTLENVDNENQTSLRADDVLLLTGYAQDKSLFEMLEVEISGENLAPTIDRDTMQTNVPGVYAIGTAAAGTQRSFKLFIENCHAHVARVSQAITQQAFKPDLINRSVKNLDLPES